MSNITKININGSNYDVGEPQKTDTKNVLNQSVDFAVVDESDNIIIAVDKGHVKTKYFDSSEIGATSAKTVLATMEKGSILASSGLDFYDGTTAANINIFNSNVRSAFFIKTNGATSVTIAEKATYSLFEYDENHEFIQKDNVSEHTQALQDTCMYVRFCYPDTSLDPVTITVEGGSGPIQEKRVAQKKYYPDPEDLTTFDYVECLSYQVEGSMYTTARLMLPPNYSISGKPVPLIMWDSGDGSFQNWYNYNTLGGSEGRAKGLRYLRDQGFAVLEIYSWGSVYNNKYIKCGTRSAMPIPTHLKTHEKGVEYVLSRFNIDANNVFHVSKSGSGKLSLYYAQQKPSFNLKEIYAMAPVFDDFAVGTGGNDFRKAINADMCFEDLPQSERNANLVSQYPDDTPLSQYLNGTPQALGGSVDENSNPTGFRYLEYNVTSAGEIGILNITDNQKFIKLNAGKFARVAVSWTNLIGASSTEKASESFADAEVVQPILYNSELTTGEKSTAMAALTTADCYGKTNLSMIGNGVPIMVIMARGDHQTPYLSAAEVSAQLTNGGAEATIVTLNGTHSAPDESTSGENVHPSITTINNIAYTNVSIGWYLICKDIQMRHLSQIDSSVAAYVADTYSE